VPDTRRVQALALQSRLHIPLLFGLDVIHGYQTVFPVPLGEAASWDLEAIEESARIAAREASASGIHWTFAPMVDIGRDPRWGRVMEGAGEDTTWVRASPPPACAASRARRWAARHR
jgi:beta-glucosidase